MNISPVSPKAQVQTFKGTQEINSEKPKQTAKDSAVIAEAIDRNTQALENLAEQVRINNFTLYAIEKSKSGTKELHEKSYSKTSSPAELINYVNRNWSEPNLGWY